jgi:hypothetical protein
MIPSINALFQYLSKDLHEYQDAIRDLLKRPDHSQYAGFRPGYLCEDEPGHRRVCTSEGQPLVDQQVQLDMFPSGLSHASDDGLAVDGKEPVCNRPSSVDDLLVEGPWGALSRPSSGSNDAPHESFCEGSIGASGSAWYPGAHPAIVACNSLLRSIRKKFRDEISDSANAVAKAKFLHSNSLCNEWVLTQQTSGDEVLVGLLKKEVDDFLHPSGELLISSIDQIFDLGRLGPGASLGASGVDFYSKLFSSKLSATSFEVYYQYAERCAQVPIWGRAEFARLTAYGLPDIVSESRVTFVPKDLTQTRSICTEPTLNMFFQLGLGEILAARLTESFGIKISRQQPRNVRLARIGSIDGSIVTIDLESASDSLSLNLAREIFPSWFYNLLCEYRTPNTVVEGERVALNMVSTMGNGFTFPLQTMLFACVVRAVASSMNVRLGRASSRNARWGVYGDDIICPTAMSDRVVRLLTLIGFRVNREKSYTERYGRFRESCGGDFYMGHNVRGVYIKTLQTPQSRYVIINLLNEWSAKWLIPLPQAVGYLQDSVKHLAVPPFAAIDSGIRLPLNLTLNRYGLWHSSKNGSFLYRCYEAWVPMIEIKADGTILLPRGNFQLRRRMYNPDGLHMAFVGGYIAGSKEPSSNGRIPISLKQGERPRYRMRTRRAPFWGHSVQQQRSHAAGFWGRWNTVVPFNLRLTEY